MCLISKYARIECVVYVCMYTALVNGELFAMSSKDFHKISVELILSLFCQCKIFTTLKNTVTKKKKYVNVPV